MRIIGSSIVNIEAPIYKPILPPTADNQSFKLYNYI